MISHIYSNESCRKLLFCFQQLFAVLVSASHARTTVLVLPMAILMFVLVPRASLELTANVSSICVVFVFFYFSTW